MRPVKKASFAVDKKKKISKTTNITGSGLKNTFKNIVSHTKKHISKLKPKCKKMLMELAYATAQELASDLPVPLPRVIPVPKTGGVLPLIPIFAGLSAIGGLSGGVNGIVEAINHYKSAKKQAAGLKTKNMKIEPMCIGEGLHLKSYKNGFGIYVSNKKN